VNYIDRSREYYAAQGYAKPYKWISNTAVPFAKFTKPLSECRIGLLTTADLEKPPGKTKQERNLARNVFAHPVTNAPEHFYTQDLHWDQKATHTEDTDSFMPLNRLAECDAKDRIGSASPRFYGVMTDHSQGRASKKLAPQILSFCKEDEVDALILPAL
jgi:hypothetical protein